MTKRAPFAANVAITLNAVLAAIEHDRPIVLCVNYADGPGLPYGLFDPQRHRTFEIGMREWVTKQTRLSLGYIEQLYTFGDKGREAPAAALAGADDERIVSVGYLALAPEPADIREAEAAWRDWYAFFPWEDWRSGEPSILRERIIPGLRDWAKAGGKESPARSARIAAAFGDDWDEARALERYELMYEAGLVAEAWRDATAAGQPAAFGEKPNGAETGVAMIPDHRRILATAVGRLRGKMRYRPVLFEMTPQEFTLLQLQKLAEAILGFHFHKQNFRRSVEKSGFVEPTGLMSKPPSGRPAALFCISRKGLRENAATGLALPRLKRE